MSYPSRHATSRWRIPLCMALLLLLCTLLAACGSGDAPQTAQRGVDVQAGAYGAAARQVPTPQIPGMPSCYCPMPTTEATLRATVDTATPVETATPVATPVSAAPTQSSSGGKIVAVDPGHGGSETGAVATSGLEEKDVNLRIALKLAALLNAGGYTPVLTRNSDSRVNTAGLDLNGNGVVDTDDDLQARVNIANAAHADILVSIHNDSSYGPSVHGTRVYYSLGRPFVDKSIQLATELQTGIVSELRAAGYNALDEGISNDGILDKPYGHLFLLGPLSPRVARASNMPGALGESLYLSNPVEGSLLARDYIVSAIAQGYYDGISRYFNGAR
jgi:N-acetylmuramoyl-L-alanine amidase